MFFWQNHLQQQVCKAKVKFSNLKMDPEENERAASELSAGPVNKSYEPSLEEIQAIRQSRLQYLKWYFTSKEGWIGDYVSLHLIIPCQTCTQLYSFLVFAYITLSHECRQSY